MAFAFALRLESVSKPPTAMAHNVVKFHGTVIKD